LDGQSFIFSELTRHYFHPIDFCFRGLLYLFGKQWPREILCSLPIICSRFAENPNIIYVSIGAGQSFAPSCIPPRAGTQNFSAPTEMYKIYRQGRTTSAIIILTISVVGGGVCQSVGHHSCRILTYIRVGRTFLIRTSAFAEAAAEAHAGCSHDAALALLVVRHARAEHVLCAFARLERNGMASVRLLAVCLSRRNKSCVTRN
jgi:hypothetical protein